MLLLRRTGYEEAHSLAQVDAAELRRHAAAVLEWWAEPPDSGR